MKKAFLIILLFNILRLILIAFIPVLPNEAIFISELGTNTFHYLSTDTVINWISSIVVLFFGKNIFAIRLVIFVLALFAQWSLYLLIKKIIRPSRKYLSWAVISTTAAITLISVVSVADTILLLFWVLSILTLYNAIFEDDKKSWLLSGIFMGVAILNKLTGIALPAGLFIFLIFSSRYRKTLFTSGPYLTLIVSTLFSIPIFTGIIKLKNPSMQIDQIEAIFEYLQVSATHYTSFITFQIILIFPVLYIGLWWVTFKYFGRIFKKPNQVNTEFWFLLSFFLPLFMGFHLVSFFSWVDFLGLIPVYITGMIILLKLIKSRWLIWSLGFSIVIHLLIILGIFVWI